MCAQPPDNIAQSARKVVELAARHRTKDSLSERSMIALQLSDEPLSSWRERDQRGSPVGWMRLTYHEAICNERIHEPGHRPWRHLQRLGEDSLSYRAAQTQLPDQVRAGRRELERCDRPRHVLVQEEHELQHAVEKSLGLL
jgi:hypothetical protein